MSPTEEEIRRANEYIERMCKEDEGEKPYGDNMLAALIMRNVFGHWDEDGRYHLHSKDGDVPEPTTSKLVAKMVRTNKVWQAHEALGEAIKESRNIMQAYEALGVALKKLNEL